MDKIHEDKRPIKSVIFVDGGSISVGPLSLIEKIVPYQENGEYCHLTWLAVYENGVIERRINPQHIESILYS